MTITRRDAEQALAAVRKQFAAYLAPMTIDGTVYDAECPEPELVEGYGRAPFAIVWEDGPSEWAYRATEGGSSEEDRALLAEANAEFGASAKVTDEEPVTFPKRVYAEPYYSFVLCLYPN